jgi:nanoRNase/pAp phosphatase (c-di-AMP/oligoRNAs hydrolase)
MTPNSDPAIQQSIDAIRSRRRFVLSSHARPDGDSIGSQLAMAYALRALGKDVTVVNKDAAPGPIMAFPGVDEIVVADRSAAISTRPSSWSAATSNEPASADWTGFS